MPSTATCEITGDRTTLKLLLPKLVDIVEHHMHGTRFGIGVDPQDGLLRQGQQGYQLTWMDAKVDDWVVTPRRGKAVEINALWYNALRLLEGWLQEEGQEAAMRAHERDGRSRPRVLQPALLVRAGRLSLRRGRRRKRRTTTPAAPTRCWPFRSTTRCSTKRAGSPCWTW